MKTATEIVNQLSKVTKSVWPSILQQWSDDLLDEVWEHGSHGLSSYEIEKLGKIITGIKHQINS